jgi:superfamily II DNA/RNA helicase
LIFTGSVATAGDLYAALKSNARCGLVTSRERASTDGVLEAFRRGILDVIVSTDLASEGLNLQRAGAVIHYDIPWNPVKLEQRNGRSFRIGQTRPAVRAIYFLPETRETGVVRIVSGKNRERRRIVRCGIAPGRAEEVPNMLRPRLTASSAAIHLIEAARRSGFALPETVARRHKAGLERLLDEMSREYLDRRKVDDLIALLAAELAAPRTL